MNNKVVVSDEQKVEAVRKVLEGAKVQVLSIRKRMYHQHRYVFETDFLEEEEIDAIRMRFHIRGMSPVHNHGFQKDHFDDVRIRVDIEVINP